MIDSRRPRTELDSDKEIIKKAWDKKRVGARLLFYDLKSEGHKIPHNKINNYLLVSENGAGMRESIQEASFMETGIELRNLTLM